MEDIDIAAGVIRFHRPKVDKVQTLRLPPNALRVYTGYGDAPVFGSLVQASNESG